MGMEIINLQKFYGKKEALKRVSFTMKNDEVVALLGRNGAGKTTTIKIIMQIIDADGGEVLYDGKKLDLRQIKIGYLPEERGLYLNYSVADQIAFFGALNGLSKQQSINRLKTLLEEFGISEYLKKEVKTLSKGNKQKIQLISALLHNPDIVILDEPFSGLDPINIDLFKNKVKQLKKEKKTIIFSSHRMEDVEELCNQIVLLKDGEIASKGSIYELKDKHRTQNLVYLNCSSNPKNYVLNKGMDIQNNGNNSYIVFYRTRDQVNGLVHELISDSIEISKLEYYEPSLQEIFVKELNS